MNLVGVEQRAKDARSALNRLHHEVEATGYLPEEKLLQQELVNGLDTVVECIAILTNIARKLGPVAEANGRAESLAGLAQWWDGYHKVPR